MKNIFLLLLLIGGLFACDNFEIEHPDFDYTAGYFPYQYPVRTLVLGDYIYDNSNDNDHKFVISVAMGGVYKNEMDREFEFVVDESLCDNVLFGTDGDPIQAMPQNYYTLSDDSKIVIPAGKFNGGVEVQLTDAFFNDSLAIQLGYVIPLRLIGSEDVDSVLVGRSGNPNADPRKAGQWIVPPKNYTMFAVKYINEFHGTYFHYGESRVNDASNNPVEENVYNERYLVDNSTSKLVTTGRNQVSLTTFLNSEVMAEEVTLLLNFNGNNCTVSAPEGSSFTISGSGEFKTNEYEWGNKERNGIVLNFAVSNGEYTYEANDILVVRDRGVVLETYSPVVTD